LHNNRKKSRKKVNFIRILFFEKRTENQTKREKTKEKWMYFHLKALNRIKEICGYER